MRFPTRHFLLLACFVGAALPAFAEVDGVPDEAERNKMLLDQWRNDPDHLRRLQAEFKAFQALPKAQQEKYRQLDKALHQADPASQQRLWGVMERYYLWLESLPDRDRGRVNAARDNKDRLRIVQEICDRQWLDRLPEKDREDIEKLPAEKRKTEVARLRRTERERRLAWQKSFQQSRPLAKHDGPRPARLGDFPTEVQTFFNELLAPMLTVREKESLAKAEGHWPALALTVLELNERHPILPAAANRTQITRYQDLPEQMKSLLPRKRLINQGLWPTLHRHEGRWPDFAIAFTELVRKDGKELPFQMGACRPRDFSRPIQNFLTAKLDPALSESDRARLKETEGKWPEYPRLLHELAHSQNLVIPGMSLPGPGEIWQAARNALPDVPDRVLREFAVAELTTEERARLKLSLADPASRDRIKQAYFKKHPNELRRYKRLAIERPE